VVKDLKGISTQYAHARELQYEAWADEILELADRCRMGVRTVTNEDGSVTTFTADMVDRAKLQIDARKWLLAKLNPKRYGDHVPQVPQAPARTEIRVNPFGRKLPQEGVLELAGTNGHLANSAVPAT
jgi:hypothetical protein